MDKNDIYQDAGVSYQDMDPLKLLAQKLSKGTSSQLIQQDGHVVEESRGESAFVWQEAGTYRAFVVEGLGTKNRIADEMFHITGKSYYDAIAQDTVAMIVNDLIVVGAMPQVINAYFAAGNSEWFKNIKRSQDLLTGWSKACELAGATWGGGETEVLQNLIMPDAIDLSGACIGRIIVQKPILGQDISHGDSIILIESNGVHANGLTLLRNLVTNLTDGYRTKLQNGQLFGEELLRPTHLYVKLVRDIISEDIIPHYMINITGHGWRKIMRANQTFRYVITDTPEPSDLFSFIQQKLDCTDKDMYGTFNMGAGFALIIASDQAERVLAMAAKNNLKAWLAGYVEKGKKEVVIRPKNITFTGETLQIR